MKEHMVHEVDEISMAVPQAEIKNHFRTSSEPTSMIRGWMRTSRRSSRCVKVCQENC